MEQKSSESNKNRATPIQKPRKPLQNQALSRVLWLGLNTVDTFLEHLPGTLLHNKCALCVSKNSLPLARELEYIIRVWADLDDKVKQKVLKLISKEVQK